MNAHHEPIPFVLPGEEHIEWLLLLDTATDEGFLKEPRKVPSGDDVEVIGRGLCLLKLEAGEQAEARKESWKKREVAWSKIEKETRKTFSTPEKETAKED